MIAVDSSSLVAVAFDEPEAQSFTGLLMALPCVVGWPTILETRMVLHGKGTALGIALVDEWAGRPNVHCAPFDSALYRLAADAFARFGRGHHPARLNFGDCMAYAVARQNEVPLLYKGTDFGLTDIRSALP